MVGVSVLEARDLTAKSSRATLDPFVRINCGNLDPQITQIKYKSNSATWNQSFTFTGLMMNEYELESFELIFHLFDHNDILANEFIGSHSVGLSTVYRHANHEFHKVWLRLVDPQSASPCQSAGFLRVSCFIVGPDERPPLHAQHDSDEEQEEEDLD